MGYEIFVSYSTKDKHFVDAMVHRLEDECYRCWYAPRDIAAGVTWPAAISKAFRETPVMILVFSASSNESAEISRELSLASANRCMVIPVRIENVSPSEELEYHLSNRHWLDVYDLETDGAISRVIEGLRRYADLFPGRNAGHGPGACGAAGEAASGARNTDARPVPGVPPSVPKKPFHGKILAAVAVLLLLLAGAGLYNHNSESLPEKDPTDSLVEAAPGGGLFRFVSPGRDALAYTLLVASPEGRKGPREFLVALMGLGGKADGKILRCMVEYTDTYMNFYYGPYAEKQVILRIDQQDRGFMRRPGSSEEVPVVFHKKSYDTQMKQAFVAAFKEGAKWTDRLGLAQK